MKKSFYPMSYKDFIQMFPSEKDALSIICNAINEQNRATEDPRYPSSEISIANTKKAIYKSTTLARHPKIDVRKWFYVIYAQHLYPRVSLKWLKKTIADISYNTINGIAQCIKKYMVAQNGTLNWKVHDEIITAVCTLIQNR